VIEPKLSEFDKLVEALEGAPKERVPEKTPAAV